MLKFVMTIIGAMGLVLVILGMLNERPKRGYLFYILGGIFLEIYSIHVGNVIFIILQLVFIAVAVWKLVKRKKN